MSAARPIFKKPTQWEDHLKVIGDPLTIEQQIKIIDFVYDYVYALLKADHENKSFKVGKENRTAHYLLHTVLTNLQNPFPPTEFDRLSASEKETLLQAFDELTFAPINQGGESFKVLEQVLADPALKAKEFGLDEKVRAQTYAAKILIISVLAANLRVKKEAEPEGMYNFTSEPYGEVMGTYQEHLTESYLVSRMGCPRSPYATDDNTISQRHLRNMKSLSEVNEERFAASVRVLPSGHQLLAGPSSSLPKPSTDSVEPTVSHEFKQK